MKRKLAFIITVGLLSVVFSACSLSSGLKLISLIDDPHAEANAIMIKILKTLNNKDAVEFKRLFSKNVAVQLENINLDIEELFAYYQGNYVSYEWAGSHGETTWDHGNKQEILYLSYEVRTSNTEYRFAIQFYSKDTSDENNEGIHSLYLIKREEDTNPLYGYVGDGAWTPGIHIGVKNTLPREDDATGVKRYGSTPKVVET